MNKPASLLNRTLKKLQRQIVKKAIIVFRGFEPFTIDIDGYKTTRAIKNKAPLVILGCAHFYEKSERYQLQSLVDINKILKLEQQSSEVPFLFKVGSYNGKERVVTKAFFKPTVLEKLPECNLIIPESWLVAEQLENTLSIVEYMKKKFVFFPKQYSYSFVEQAGLLQNLDDVYSSAGVPSTTKASESDVTWLNKKAVSFKALFSLTTSLYGLITPNNLKEKKQVDWKKPAIAFCSVLIGYLALSQLYLHFTLSSQQDISDELNTQLAPIFEQIETNKRNSDLANVLASFEGKSGWEVNAWLALKPLLNSDVQIFNINFLVTKRVAVRAQTTGKPASELLKEVLQLPSIKSAQFSGRVNKQKDSEIFTIMIEVDDGK